MVLALAKCSAQSLPMLDSQQRYSPSQQSLSPEHLDHFNFIGRCAGLLAIRRSLGAYFVTSFYEMMLRKKLPLTD
ncbi:hypothetical protein NEOLEDRAFT_837047 [Neolentinus lepideus HHB14362 ss-1]|uniref:Uncharacterized protein n=1 Tax=Neolentinus lepideus HHB14362 ss-1 TaxID=1314782 RepID=A0A165P5Q3_9AGAM|nr:hypothetical protein NEOLEDRAFT_837047 [Neolentinus lepideus HHB14362 ss-1]